MLTPVKLTPKLHWVDLPHLTGYGYTLWEDGVSTAYNSSSPLYLDLRKQGLESCIMCTTRRIAMHLPRVYPAHEIRESCSFGKGEHIALICELTSPGGDAHQSSRLVGGRPDESDGELSESEGEGPRTVSCMQLI